MLLSAGVDAFFSGCLTTTVDAVYPTPGDGGAELGETPYVAAVDLTAGQVEKITDPNEVVTHITPDTRDADLVSGVRAADALAQRTFDLRRVMARRHPFGVTGFETSVLVLDLARLRADGFVNRHLPELAGRYGLGWADALHAYAGGDRVELPAWWCVLAGMDVAEHGDAVDYGWVGGVP